MKVTVKCCDAADNCCGEKSVIEVVKEYYGKAQEQNLFKTTCVDMVVSAVELLEELGY